MEDMLKKNLRNLGTTTLAFTMLLTGCSSNEEETSSDSKEEKEQVLNIIESEEIPTMNHTLATDQISFNAYSNTTEGLFRTNNDGDLIDGLAEDMTVSDDQLTYTFKIRDALWSNGDNVTANDFVYAWQEMLNPDNGAGYAFILYYLKNGEKINNGELPVDELGAKAIDDQTLEVTLEKPVPFFQRLLAFGAYYPKNQKFVEEQGEQYALEANTTISCGPFVMTEWNHGKNYKLEKNESYWDKDEVKLDAVNVNIVSDGATSINLFETGKADSSLVSSDLVEKYKNDDRFSTQLTQYIHYLQYNQASEELHNQDLRLALSGSFDRGAIVDTILDDGSVPLYGMVPTKLGTSADGEDFRETNGNFHEFNLEDSQSHWEKAKESLGKDSFELELLVQDNKPALKKVAEYLKSEWEENLQGLTIDVNVVPFKQRLQAQDEGTYQIVISGWGPDYQDPMTNLELFTSSRNSMGYSSTEYDDLISKANNEYATDLDKRWNAMLEAEQLLMADAPISPIYQQGESIVKQSYVKDTIVNQFGGKYDYKYTYIE